MSRRRSPTIAISLMVALTIGVWAPPAAAFPPASRIRNWEPEFMASRHTYTRSEALAQAAEFDLIVADSYAFRDHVGAMRTRNPNLVLLAYQNGGYRLKSDGTKFAEDLYAHDKYGKRITSRGFGNYLMDVSNPAWVDAVVAKCVDHLNVSHYNGCFLDSLGPAALSLDYVTGLPTDPSTGEVWVRSDYLRATSSLAAAVRRRVASSKYVVANGIQNGREYFASSGPTGQLADPIDGAMVELFVRPPFVSLTKYRSVTDWKRDVDMLVDAGTKGRVLLCVTKVWTKATIAQKKKLFRYALGTFLLGTNGRSYFSFLYDRQTWRTSSLWDARLGPPAAPYFLRRHVFRRLFQNGLVLVNPSDAWRRVRLSTAYRTLGGNPVTRLRMAPHSAVLLLSA